MTQLNCKKFKFVTPSTRQQYDLVIEEKDIPTYTFYDVLEFLKIRLKNNNIITQRENLKVVYNDTNVNAYSWETIKYKNMLSEFVVVIVPINCDHHNSTPQKQYKIFH